MDLALTLPIFVGYHLGVVFLRVKNASDLVTGALLELAHGSVETYLGMTLGIGAVFAATLALFGRGQAFRLEKFVQIALEGVAYAIVMRIGVGVLVGKLFVARMVVGDPFSGVVMSLGAGFYEELTFRAVLFALGAKALKWLFSSGAGPGRGAGWTIAGALCAAAIFSGVHYVGPLADTFSAPSFVFRFALGLFLTAIYAARGFAAAVWAHALYDVWVLVL